MKNLIKITVIALLGLTACHQADPVKAFIPGTYTKSVTGEFSKADDTLIINVFNGNACQIIRHTTYQVIRDGKLLPPQHQTENLQGIYDDGRQVLQETTKGKTFTFDPAKHILIVNAKGIYKKLN
ncbi:MAG TPA: hypothetical protein VFE53_04875 [Mucilaginibacter sp.]|jgi:hypothetical protein|nr:hypothetical protein [Mucilaginibacter sp.]